MDIPALPKLEERSPLAVDFLARWQAQLLIAQRRSGLQGACGIRSDLELAPHQARTVLEVLSAPRVRHVLADEVGMGKTIEALMVYQALRLERPRLRTMVLVPGHLTYQWLGEIYLRAHRVFAIATKEREDAIEQGTNVLLDREWLTADENGQARERLLGSFGGPSDAPRLLIVDEAHRLKGAGYDLVRELARSVEHVLLLTATPVELEEKRDDDQLRYEELLRLLDPDLTQKSFAAIRSREARFVRHFLARPAGEKKTWLAGFAALDPEDARLGALARAGDEANLLDYAAASGLAAWRVLRHRRADAPRVFKRRLAEIHPVPALPGYAAALDSVRKVLKKDPDALERFEWRASISVEQASSTIEKLENDSGLDEAARTALKKARATFDAIAKEHDPKLVRLADLISKTWADDRKAGRKTLRKFLVFVSHRSTLDRVAHALEEDLATDVAVFHEGLDNTLREDGEPPERLQQLLDFRGKPSTAILVCQDLAAEGHNLHSTCHTVVLYDLPRNPNTTEQRIGRVDRLGQSRDVTVHVLLLEGTAGPAQAERQGALGVFTRSLGALAPSEEDALAKGDALATRRDLTSPLRAHRNVPSQELADRVRSALELPPGWVFRASRRFAEWYGDTELAQGCLGQMLTRAVARAFEIKAEKNETPPPRVREALRFRLARGGEPIPGYRDTWGTCDRDEALEQDHLQFFASGHPFVEDVFSRATAGAHGVRQAIRVRFPGGLGKEKRRGLLMHFLWDPALALGDAGAAAARLARIVYPTLSVPVVVSVGESRKLEVEVGPPAPKEPSVRRSVLGALVELDPTFCEAVAADSVSEVDLGAWAALGEKAALEYLRERLAGYPTGLGARTLARAASEAARDSSNIHGEEFLAVAEKVLPGVKDGQLAEGLVLDALTTFEVR